MTTLLERLEKYEKRLSDIVIEIENTNEVSNLYFRKKINQINKIYDEMQMTFKKYFSKDISLAYNKDISREIRKIKKMKFNFSEKLKTAIRNLHYREYLNSDFSKRSINNILNDGLSALSSGVDQGKKTFIRIINKTQQINISENKINKMIAKGYIEGGSVNSATKKVLTELMKKAKDGKYITVIDKNGNPINYNVKSYAELLSRTKLINAQAQSTIDIAKTIGNDLVQMSSHNTDCAQCAPLEGKIYSITGNDPDFPKLDFEMPVHPRCKHSLTNVFREVLEYRGIQKYIDFANGTTSKHPTLTEFVPLKERELE